MMAKCSVGNVPQEMKEAVRWIPVKGKKPQGKGWTNPGNWKTFQAALDASRPYPGFVLGDGFFCLDYDHIEGNSSLDKLIASMDAIAGPTYTEKSQSGKGLHAFYKGSVPKDFPPLSKIPLEGGGMLEVWSGNGEGRQIAVTGNIVSDTATLADGTDLLPFLKGKACQQGKKEGQQKDGPFLSKPCVLADEWPLTVEEIPDRIRKSKQGAKFKALFDDGDMKRYGDNHSDADAGLMCMLPFWCGGNPEIMEAVFSQSVLAQRDKWTGREDYRRRTVSYAIAVWDGVLYKKPRAAAEDFDPVDVPGGGWPVKDDHGKPLTACWENVKYLLDISGSTCRYNLLTKRAECTGDYIDAHGGAFMEDQVVTIIRGLAHRAGLKLKKEELRDSMDVIARMNQYSPVRDFLTAVKETWDGMDRIGGLFDRLEIEPFYAGNRDFYEILFRKWLKGAADIAFNEGEYSMQGVLVLQGPQGIGKTRFFRALLPDPSWGADGMLLDPNSKDSVMAATGCWIVELGEIGMTLRREKLSDLKAFITKGFDLIRAPYGRSVWRLPRMTAFGGSVNGDSFLKDRTGERRYWVIPVRSINGLEAIDPIQLWGNVMNLDIKSYLEPDEIKKLDELNRPFKAATDEETLLLDMLDWEAPMERWTERSATAVSWDIGFQGKRPVMVGRAIASIARADNRVKVKSSHTQGRGYLLPPHKDAEL